MLNTILLAVCAVGLVTLCVLLTFHMMHMKTALNLVFDSVLKLLKDIVDKT